MKTVILCMEREQNFRRDSNYSKPMVKIGDKPTLAHYETPPFFCLNESFKWI